VTLRNYLEVPKVLNSHEYCEYLDLFGYYLLTFGSYYLLFVVFVVFDVFDVFVYLGMVKYYYYYY